MSTNSSRFVLADPSISSTGGHYLEYAMRVLDAVAQTTDYETILAVNKSFHDVGYNKYTHEIIPAFSFDIWGRSPSAKNEKELSPAEKKAALRHRLSKLAWIWHLTADPEETRIYLSRFGTSSVEVRWMEKLVQVRAEIGRFTKAENETELDLIRRYLAGERQPEASPVAEFGQLEENMIKAETVYENIRALISSTKLTSNDYLFMPTMGWHDLTGVNLLLERHGDEELPKFGLLFRRNIYTYYPDFYVHLSYSVHDLCYAFDRLKHLAKADQISVFTDTHQLTQQYKTVCTLPVHTLPIPAPEYNKVVLEETTKRGGKIVMGYLGDAREEKGFQYLVSLLATMDGGNQSAIHGENENALENAKLRTQCYYASDFSEIDIILATTLLKSSHSENCEIINGVLDAASYANAIETMDVILIPYERGNYAARSSGIFAEALAAGKPVIVSAGTWMANELDVRTYAYHRKKIKQSDIISNVGQHAIKWDSSNPSKSKELKSAHPIDVTSEKSVRIGTQELTFLEASVPRRASHLWLSFDANFKNDDGFVRVTYAPRNADGEPIGGDQIYVLGGQKNRRSLVLPIVDGQEDVWICFHNAYSPADFTISNLEINWLNTNASIANNVGGVVFNNDGEVAEKTENFVRAANTLALEYDEILKNTESIALEMRKYHNAVSLVSEICRVARLRTENKIHLQDTQISSRTTLNV